MTRRIVNYLRDHALAATALVFSVLALAGSSYAAVTISGSQIRNHTITPVKFDQRSINGVVRAWAIVAPNGHVVAGTGKPKVTLGETAPGAYTIRWGVQTGRCGTAVTIDAATSPPTEHLPSVGAPAAAFTAGYAVASSLARHHETVIQTYNQQGQPTPLGFDVLVIC